MPSELIGKNKVKKNLTAILLAGFFSIFFLKSAQAADMQGTLTWEVGRYQVVQIDSAISAKINKLELTGNGVSQEFKASSLSASRTLYQLNLTKDFALGTYLIKATFSDGTFLSYAKVKVVAIQSLGYNPATDFKTTSKLVFALFTFLVLFGGRGLGDDFKDDQTTYEGISAESIGRKIRKNEAYAKGLISSLGLDEQRNVSVIKVSKFSPLLSKIIADGGYLQYSLGALVLFFPLFGAVLGALAFHDIQGIGHIVPPSLAITIAILILGSLDASASFLTFISFTLLALSSGYFQNGYDIRTLLGLAGLWITPALIANGIRPLRRSVRDVGKWERMTDILLGTALTGWAVHGIVLGLNGFAHLKLPLANHANTCAYFVMGTIFIRYLIEEYVNRRNHAYLNFLSPVFSATQGSSAKIFSLFIKSVAYLFFTISFMGMHWQLWASLALFITPPILGNFKERFKNSSFLYQVLPVGVPAIVLISLLNRIYQSSISGWHLDPAEKTRTLFILFAIPAFLISILKMFGRAPKSGDVRWYMRERNKVLYRTAGPLVLILATLITLGVI